MSNTLKIVCYVSGVLLIFALTSYLYYIGGNNKITETSPKIKAEYSPPSSSIVHYFKKGSRYRYRFKHNVFSELRSGDNVTKVKFGIEGIMNEDILLVYQDKILVMYSFKVQRDEKRKHDVAIEKKIQQISSLKIVATFTPNGKIIKIESKNSYDEEILKTMASIIKAKQVVFKKIEVDVWQQVENLSQGPAMVRYSRNDISDDFCMIHKENLFFIMRDSTDFTHDANIIPIPPSKIKIKFNKREGVVSSVVSEFSYVSNSNVLGTITMRTSLELLTQKTLKRIVGFSRYELLSLIKKQTSNQQDDERTLISHLDKATTLGETLIAIEAIGNFSLPTINSFKALQNIFLKSKRSKVKEKALIAVGSLIYKAKEYDNELTGEAIKFLLKWSDSYPKLALISMGSSGLKDFFPIIKRHLTSNDPSLRELAVQQLRYIPGNEALDAAVNMIINENDDSVKRRGIETFDSRSYSKNTLVALYDIFEKEKNPILRRLILQKLIEHGKCCISELVSILEQISDKTSDQIERDNILLQLNYIQNIGDEHLD